MPRLTAIKVSYFHCVTAFSQFNSYSVTVRTELVEVCRSCFDKLSTNGGCNCPKLKTLYNKHKTRYF
ncbi:hypothetical protein CRENPOLYSF1_190050 [Crenothrix polyspora]|uniref:Uncharacterized protein n=1 Tax=Crenothrix polyspora TaxID=360316 RepID=A0A1R4H554_9GAMM|nr:hypothetical protein CRENPOLYSF1_190050 [Crenothrix polyspora]